MAKSSGGLMTMITHCLLSCLTAGQDHAPLRVSECELDFMRLPLRVQPDHYKLDIATDPEADTFSGGVEIRLGHDRNPNDALCSRGADGGKQQLIACDRSRIILNAHASLEILEAEYLDQDSGLAIPIASVCRSSNDLMVVELSRAPGPSSRGTLRMRFIGEMRTDFTGLFRADSRDTRTNENKHFALTQFESAQARRVFPCFDEPEFKATFELSLEHASHLLALGNMQAVRTERVRRASSHQDLTRTHFATTPRMSSYLLAFAVGEFDRIQTSVLDGRMTLSWYTPPGRAQEARFPMKTAVDAYQALEEFFNMSQPISKIDFVACKEFPGAMENWGLITMEEVTALPNVSSFEATSMHYSIITVIHELAHQWFGNLVTMRWWDDLWLNEGFAEWMAHHLTHELYPELGTDYIYLLRVRRSALAKDADEDGTHPIKNSKLQSVKEIEESFDEITYEKADAVISMLTDYIGQEKFKEGLRAYIRRNRFNNTDDSDLWSALGTASGLSVKSLMSSWILQAGYPLIQVSLKSNHDDDDDDDDLENSSSPPLSATRHLKVSQTRFGAAAVRGSPSAEQTWMVPISLWVSDGQDRLKKLKFILAQRSDKIKLPAWFDPAKGHWLKLNANFAGFYRVAYQTPELVDGLRRAIESKQMNPIDRLQVLDDLVGMKKAGLLGEDKLLEALAWYRHEDHHAVVSMVARALMSLGLHYQEDHKGRGLYNILIEYYERNGKLSEAANGASLIKRMARYDTIDQLIRANYRPVIEDAIGAFEETDGQFVPEFVRDPVYSAVAMWGSEQQLEQVMSAIESLGSERVKAQSIIELKYAVRGDPYRESLVKRRFPEEA